MQVEMWTWMVLTQEQWLLVPFVPGFPKNAAPAFVQRCPSLANHTVHVAVTYGPRRKDLHSQDEKLAFLPPLTTLAILASVQNIEEIAWQCSLLFSFIGFIKEIQGNSNGVGGRWACGIRKK
ncbi:hypothetical protein NE237_001022 [Protea cynaroides]|uniref:Uncharacterized protein n=1 Tax=Protea cynaroides TaxID=273540 RepID=A0A9Q0KT75_9MAGN|nr:hypothetical protein NE237_001022 [Protea cynaroides]